MLKLISKLLFLLFLSGCCSVHCSNEQLLDCCLVSCYDIFNNCRFLDIKSNKTESVILKCGDNYSNCIDECILNYKQTIQNTSLR